jgi:hypothetical protein
MIAVRAVFFTGIAGSTFFEYKGIFTVDDLLPFYPGRCSVYGYILALREARYRFALCAFILVELKLRHIATNLLSPNLRKC